MVHPNLISVAAQAPAPVGGGRNDRGGMASRGPLTQSSLSSQLDYATQGSQGGSFNIGLSQESVGIGPGGSGGVNGFQSQGTYG